MAAMINQMRDQLQQNQQQMSEVRIDINTIKDVRTENSSSSHLDLRDQGRKEVGTELRKDFKNIRLSKFNGKGVNAAENWLIELEAYFVIKGYSFRAKTTVVGIHLVDTTLEWWHT